MQIYFIIYRIMIFVTIMQLDKPLKSQISLLIASEETGRLSKELKYLMNV